MKPFINDYTDILELLDEKVRSVNWDHFYSDRKRPVPFITQNTMPDENLAAFLKEQTEIRKYQNGVPETIQGLDFMWVCLFRNKAAD